MTKAFMRAERVRNFSERLAKVISQHLTIGDVVGHFAQTIHIIGEGDQPCRDIGHLFKGKAYP